MRVAAIPANRAAATRYVWRQSMPGSSVDDYNLGDSALGRSGGILRCKDIVYAGAHAVASCVTAVPGNHSTIGTRLVDNVAGCIGNLHQRLVHKAGDGNPSGVIGTYRVGICIDVVVGIGGGRRGAIEGHKPGLQTKVYNIVHGAA